MKDQIHERMSVGFSAREWDNIQSALRVFYHCGQDDAVLEALSSREVNHFLRLAIDAVAVAVKKAGCVPMPIGVNLRHETPEERADRLNETSPGPAGIPVLDLEWLRQNFPDRWS